MRRVDIISYFSLPTDLAAEMRDWPEFVSGQEYTVELLSDAERVSVALGEEETDRFVSVVGEGTGPLFDRVVGRAVWALAAHSDTIMIDRHA